MPRRKDIWRPAIVDRPMTEILAQGLAGAAIRWFPQEPAFTFLADPFGIEVDGVGYVFAEAYDYRTRHGVIDVFTLGPDGAVSERARCLQEAWHLSYPQVFAAEGAIWMLPEAHRSGRLTLYRAARFPLEWVAEREIALDCVPVDATILHHQGTWWLFYSPATTKQTRMGHLHVAFADALSGPWHPHPGNPVRIDPASSRPGGTPIVAGGQILLPVQDCTRTYGGALRTLTIATLDKTAFVATAGPALRPRADFAPYDAGLHTMSAFGSQTLIDAKRIDRSLAGMMLDLKRSLGRYDPEWRAPPR